MVQDLPGRTGIDVQCLTVCFAFNWQVDEKGGVRHQSESKASFPLDHAILHIDLQQDFFSLYHLFTQVHGNTVGFWPSAR